MRTEPLRHSRRESAPSAPVVRASEAENASPEIHVPAWREPFLVTAADVRVVVLTELYPDWLDLPAADHVAGVIAHRLHLDATRLAGEVDL